MSIERRVDERWAEPDSAQTTVQPSQWTRSVCEGEQALQRRGQTVTAPLSRSATGLLLRIYGEGVHRAVSPGRQDLLDRGIGDTVGQLVVEPVVVEYSRMLDTSDLDVHTLDLIRGDAENARLTGVPVPEHAECDTRAVRCASVDEAAATVAFDLVADLAARGRERCERIARSPDVADKISRLIGQGRPSTIRLAGRNSPDIVCEVLHRGWVGGRRRR